ncbi:MAG: hypothetical protein DRP83_00125 [Planctomycetota bacterium]|nr:MAG: hypothetical protein DRP83_00125 [Planctomycetota bacterium]
MPMYDYRCPDCECETEEIVSDIATVVSCPECGARMVRFWKSAPPTLSAIIPSYPGCKGQKAGYVHSHGPKRPATKIQSGYGGAQSPKS